MGKNLRAGGGGAWGLRRARGLQVAGGDGRGGEGSSLLSWGHFIKSVSGPASIYKLEKITGRKERVAGEATRGEGYRQSGIACSNNRFTNDFGLQLAQQ